MQNEVNSGTGRYYVATAKRKLYLETAIVSYLTAWSSRDLIRVACQEITREWGDWT